MGIVERNKERSSNFELMRIIMMIAIIAHHYVVNSGITNYYNYSNITANMIFLQLFGFAGKAMINGFLLITGYFMIKSKFSIEKFIRIYLQVKFYKVTIYILLILAGVDTFSFTGFIKMIFNFVYGVNIGFTATFLLLYLLSPFINILINKLTKKQYTILLVILLFYSTIISTFSYSNNTFNEIGWYITVYMIGGYIRIYPIKIFNNKKLYIIIKPVLIILSYLSIIIIDIFNNISGMELPIYYFVNNANKILAILLAISMFLLFKNINIKYNRFINTISLATFGVLLIHANSDAMRYFIWNLTFKVPEQYYSNMLILHAILTVGIIYVVCTIIELLRMKYLEKQIMNLIGRNIKYEKLFRKINNIMNTDTQELYIEPKKLM